MEVEGLRVVKFVEPDSDCGVVADVDEAASFGNVRDVPHKQIALVDCQFGAEL